MPAPRFVIRQLARPTGRLGGLFARLLNRGNEGINRDAVDALQLRQGERVLDVGFGGGVSLPLLLDRVGAGGHVAGAELSGDMVQRARRRFGSDVDAGRLSLQEAAVETLPWEDGAFDAALTVNTVYFWSDPEAAFRELRRVLRPGGRLVVGTRSKALLERVGFPGEGYRAPSPADVADWMRSAGFEEVDVRTSPGAPLGTHLITGHAPRT